MFMDKTALAVEVDETRFSSPYYMVMKHDPKRFLDIPIYILCDEFSFSAASILVSVFKGLPNVTICGITTNGSSGRSNYFYLTHSGIRLKLSTMLSFQRNGHPLDGYGTQPDIFLDRDEKQVLGQQDTQLIRLMELIEKSE